MTQTESRSIRLKRQVTIKTCVTKGFRERARGDLSREITTIENQLQQLDAQYQQSLQQLEQLSQQGQNVSNALDQLNHEVQNKKNQLTTLKFEVSKQLNNLDKVANGELIVTGILESFVDVKIGDNIYDKIQHSEVIIEDSVVKAIRG